MNLLVPDGNSNRLFCGCKTGVLEKVKHDLGNLGLSIFRRRRCRSISVKVEVSVNLGGTEGSNVYDDRVTREGTTSLSLSRTGPQRIVFL